MKTVGRAELQTETQRRQDREAALIRVREYYLTLFDEFPAMIWRSGTDGLCNYFNRAWLDFTGRTIEQELGNGWAEGVHPDDLQACLNTYLSSFEERQPFTMDYRLRCWDGEYRWVRDFGRPFKDQDGRFAGYIGACYDITDQIAASKQLHLLTQQIVALQENERWNITRQLHNEIGQLLTILMINLEMLAGNLQAADKWNLKRLRESMDLVSEVMDKIHNLALDLRPPALDALGLNLTLKGRCLEFSRRTQIPVQYHGSQDIELDDEVNIALYRLLQEGLTNVVRHARASSIQVTLAQTEQTVSLAIEDDGIGMQVKPDFIYTTQNENGEVIYRVGLLSMKERFELLRGRIEIRSEPGCGTRLTGILPIRRPSND
jgi:PAS domain S-box-containing protein